MAMAVEVEGKKAAEVAKAWVDENEAVWKPWVDAGDAVDARACGRFSPPHPAAPMP